MLYTMLIMHGSQAEAVFCDAKSERRIAAPEAIRAFAAVEEAFTSSLLRRDRKTTSRLNDPALAFGGNLKLARVFNNLISNAMKYTREGDSIFASLRVISEKNTATKYQITVADTGIGMSESFLEHLFEPFSRERRFAPASVSGTGLGMPIVKTLVQRMSGEITVKSTLDKGTTFIVTLPLAPGTDEEIEPSLEQAERNAAARNRQPLQGMTVLVAEDNEISLELMVELLERMGARALSATNGEEAYLRFSSSSPKEIDVVLLDMHMPIMDGCQASEAIRAANRDDATTVTIIAVTANAFAEDVARTTNAGMDGHLSKPIDPTGLGDFILSIVERKRRS